MSIIQALWDAVDRRVTVRGLHRQKDEAVSEK
jgi:hypothetical protein